MKKHPTADVLVNFASLRSAYDSTLEAMNYSQIRTIAIIAEGTTSISFSFLIMSQVQKTSEIEKSPQLILNFWRLSIGDWLLTDSRNMSTVFRIPSEFILGLEN